MTVGDPALNIPGPAAGWSALTVPDGESHAVITPVLPSSVPYFDHWRVYAVSVPDGNPPPQWLPGLDVSGAIPAATLSFDYAAPRDGSDVYVWAVAFDASEARAGFCLQSTMLSAIPPIGVQGPFTYDGRVIASAGLCHVNNVNNQSPPAWFTGPNPQTWYFNGPLGISLPNQISHFSRGTIWAFSTNTATFAANWPSSGVHPGTANVVLVSTDNMANDLGQNPGFLDVNLPVPATVHSGSPDPPGSWVGAGSLAGTGPWTPWADIDSCATLSIQAAGGWTFNLAWNLVNNVTSPALPGGGWKPGVPTPGLVIQLPPPQPTPLPCEPCCDPCAPGEPMETKAP